MIRKLLLLVLIIGFGVGCEDTRKCACVETYPAAVTSIMETMELLREALVVGDVDGVAELFTDRALRELFHETRESFRSNTGYYIDAKQYSLGPTSDPRDADGYGSAIAPLFFRLVGVVREFELVRHGEGWLIDAASPTTGDAGELTVVKVGFAGRGMYFDPASVVDGNIALQVQNATTETHELHILTAPVDIDITEFFEHAEDAPPLPEGRSMPEGFDFVGGVSELPAGASVTIMFSETLPAARYVIFCNAEDESGEPHSKAGEFAEFTIT